METFQQNEHTPGILEELQTFSVEILFLHTVCHWKSFTKHLYPSAKYQGIMAQFPAFMELFPHSGNKFKAGAGEQNYAEMFSLFRRAISTFLEKIIFHTAHKHILRVLILS